MVVVIFATIYQCNLWHYSEQPGLLSFQTLAHQLSIGEVSCQHSSEWNQNDQRAPKRAQGQPSPLLPQWPSLRPRVLSKLHKAGDVAETIVWTLLLPRYCPREAELWSPRWDMTTCPGDLEMEHRWNLQVCTETVGPERQFPCSRNDQADIYAKYELLFVWD